MPRRPDVPHSAPVRPPPPPPPPVRLCFSVARAYDLAEGLTVALGCVGGQIARRQARLLQLEQHLRTAGTVGPASHSQLLPHDQAEVAHIETCLGEELAAEEALAWLQRVLRGALVGAPPPPAPSAPEDEPDPLADGPTLPEMRQRETLRQLLKAVPR